MRYLFFVSCYLLTIQNACRGLFWFNSEKTRTPPSFVIETYDLFSFKKLQLFYFFHFGYYRTRFTTITPFGATTKTLTFLEGRLGLTTMKRSFPPTGTHPSPRSASVWRSTTRSVFIEITESASSLYSLIADGQYRRTSLGRDNWKSLIGSEASLQTNCNKEGFNAVGVDPHHSKARIGILGNNEGDCRSCDSRIGFGTGGQHDDNNACGNEARHGGDKGDKHIKVMGYILVQWQENTTEENLLKFFLHHDHTL